MANVLIRDVPDQIINALKQMAKLRNRPLQQELRDILINTARQPYVDVAERAREIRKKLGETRRSFTDSVELLREDRAR